MPPPLHPLHPDSSLIRSKLEKYGRATDDELIMSLLPGRPGCLKARPDGTIVDGHRGIRILRDRGIDVDGLPREIVSKDDVPGLP